VQNIRGSDLPGWVIEVLPNEKIKVAKGLEAINGMGAKILYSIIGGTPTFQPNQHPTFNNKDCKSQNMSPWWNWPLAVEWQALSNTMSISSNDVGDIQIEFVG
jgi:hypothetical protein